MTKLLIGNALSLLGSVMMVSIGLIKDKKRILLMQCVQFFPLAMGNLVLGAYTGIISGVSSLLRNLVCFFFPYTLPIKIGFLALQIIPAIFANQVGWIGWLPIASTCLFTWFLGLKDERHFKLLLLVTQLFWCVYDLWFLNYASFVFDILTVLTCTLSLLRMGKNRPQSPLPTQEK